MAQRAVTLSTTPSQLLGYNPRRTAWLVQNTDATINVRVSENGGTVATDGFVLNLLASISSLAREGGEPWNEVWAVAASGAPIVIVQEQFNPVPEGLGPNTYPRGPALAPVAMPQA